MELLKVRGPKGKVRKRDYVLGRQSFPIHRSLPTPRDDQLIRDKTAQCPEDVKTSYLSMALFALKCKQRTLLICIHREDRYYSESESARCITSMRIIQLLMILVKYSKKKQLIAIHLNLTVCFLGTANVVRKRRIWNWKKIRRLYIMLVSHQILELAEMVISLQTNNYNNQLHCYKPPPFTPSPFPEEAQGCFIYLQLEKKCTLLERPRLYISVTSAYLVCVVFPLTVCRSWILLPFPEHTRVVVVLVYSSPSVSWYANNNSAKFHHSQVNGLGTHICKDT